MDQYNKTSYAISKVITKSYSTSFSLGISAFAPQYRDAIYGIYGFVRFADEIVDTFQDYNQKQLMEDFRKETEEALKQEFQLILFSSFHPYGQRIQN